MAEATATSRNILPLGNIKLEIVHLSSPNTSDTTQTFLADPLFSIALYTEITSALVPVSASVSGKIITLGTCTGTENIVVITAGF